MGTGIDGERALLERRMLERHLALMRAVGEAQRLNRLLDRAVLEVVRLERESREARDAYQAAHASQPAQAASADPAADADPRGDALPVQTRIDADSTPPLAQGSGADQSVPAGEITPRLRFARWLVQQGRLSDFPGSDGGPTPGGRAPGADTGRRAIRRGKHAGARTAEATQADEEPVQR